MQNFYETLKYKLLYDISPNDANLTYDTEREHELTQIVDNWVKPHAPHNPTILDVGVGIRIEEFLALRVLGPQCIEGIDNDHTRWGYGFAKWNRYLDAQSPDMRRELKKVISLHQSDVRTIDGVQRDIVVALRIHPHLQNEDGIQQLIDLSKQLVVISCWRESGVGWGRKTEAEHIDELLQPYAHQLIVPMQPIGPEESHIWVLDKS